MNRPLDYSTTSEIYAEEIARILKFTRNAKKWSMQDVADRLKVVKSTYLRIENGKREMKVKQFRELCLIYNINPDKVAQIAEERTQKRLAVQKKRSA